MASRSSFWLASDSAAKWPATSGEEPLPTLFARLINWMKIKVTQTSAPSAVRGKARFSADDDDARRPLTGFGRRSEHDGIQPEQTVWRQ